MFSERIQTVIDRVDRLRDQVDDHWQIPADEALVLAQLISIGRCVSICEIGTSYGFSTLHLAAAARRQDGHVHTIDQDPKKVAAAAQNLRDAGLDDVVTMHQGDARRDPRLDSAERHRSISSSSTRPRNKATPTSTRFCPSWRRGASW